jgi:hypothetical protein
MIALIILQQTKSMIYTFWFDSDYGKFDFAPVLFLVKKFHLTLTMDAI